MRGKLSAAEPVEYPEVGVYHPALKNRVGTSIDELPHAKGRAGGTVGVLVMRSYVLAGNSLHYDGMIETLEKRGLNVIPVFASGLDAREAIERYFMKDGKATIDALVSLTGFSLVGGPAYNDAKGAQEILAKLDVPYIAAHPVEFQTLAAVGRRPARPDARGKHHHGGDPRTRRRDGAGRVRRPLGRHRCAMHRLRAELHLPHIARPRHALLPRAR